MNDWHCVGTALCPPVIQVQNKVTGELGRVENYTLEEWNLAFFANLIPFLWLDTERIIKGENMQRC